MSAPQRNSISMRQWDTTFRVTKILHPNQDMYIVMRAADSVKEIKREKMIKDTSKQNQFNYFLPFQINFACQYQFQIYEGAVLKEQETIWRQFKFDEYGDIQQDEWNKFCIVYRMHATFKGFFNLFEIYINDKQKKKKIKLEVSKSHFPAYDCYEWITSSEKDNAIRQFVFKCVSNDMQDFCHDIQLKQVRDFSINCFQIKFDKKQLNENKLSQKLRLILLENIIPDENNMGEDRKHDEKYQQIVYEKERLQLDNQSLKKEIQLLTEKVLHYQNLNERQQKQIQLITEMQNKIKETSQLELNEQNVKVKYLENQINYLQTQVEKFQKLTLQNQNFNNGDLNLLHQQQQVLFSNIPQEHKQEVTNLFNQLMSKHQDLEKSACIIIQAEGKNNKTEESEEMCDAFQQKIEKQKKENQDLRDTQIEYVNKINQKVKEIQDYQEQLKLYQKKIDELQKKLNINREYYQAHIQQIESYRNKLIQYEEQIKQLIKELEIEKQKNDFLVKELKSEQEKIQIEKKKQIEVEQTLKKQVEQQSQEFQQQILNHKNRIKQLDLQQQELNDQAQRSINNNWQLLFDISTIITEYKRSCEPEQKNKIIQAKHFADELKNSIENMNQKELYQFLNQKSNQIRLALQEKNNNLFSMLFCKRKQKKDI